HLPLARPALDGPTRNTSIMPDRARARCLRVAIVYGSPRAPRWGLLLPGRGPGESAVDHRGRRDRAWLCGLPPGRWPTPSLAVASDRRTPHPDQGAARVAQRSGG